MVEPQRPRARHRGVRRWSRPAPVRHVIDQPEVPPRRRQRPAEVGDRVEEELRLPRQAPDEEEGEEQVADAEPPRPDSADHDHEHEGEREGVDAPAGCGERDVAHACASEDPANAPVGGDVTPDELAARPEQPRLPRHGRIRGELEQPGAQPSGRRGLLLRGKQNSLAPTTEVDRREHRQRDDHQHRIDRDQQDGAERDVQEERRELEDGAHVPEPLALGPQGRQAVEVVRAFEVLDAVELGRVSLHPLIQLVDGAFLEGHPHEPTQVVEVPEPAHRDAGGDRRDGAKLGVAADDRVDEELDRDGLERDHDPARDREGGQRNRQAAIGGEGRVQDRPDRPDRPDRFSHRLPRSASPAARTSPRSDRRR